MSLRLRPARLSLTAGLILAVLACVGTAAHAAAQIGASHAEELRREATERLRVLHAEADRLAGQERTLLGQLRKLEIARQIARTELEAAEAAAAQAATDVDTVDEQVRTLETARDRERPLLASRFVDLYKLGRGRYMRMLLSAADMRDVGRAARTVAAVADRDRARVREYESRLQTLQSTRVRLTEQRQTLEQRRADAVKAQAAAAQAVAAQAALVREIDQRRDLNAQLVGELQAAQQKLEATVASAAASTPVAGLPIGPFRGALPWPTAGSARRSRSQANAMRPGLEIETQEGSPVQVVHSGQVAYAGSFEGLGNLVIVDHGDQTFTLYGHLLELGVGRGATVRAHQEIGRVGASATGQPSLYFELRVHGRAVDALAWLEPRR